MTETIQINKQLTDLEIYETILPQIETLINPDEPVISSLANVTAVLKESLDKISWVGFYLLKGKELFLGPFQGKIACTVIESGKGVCGTAVAEGKTIIVEDVDKFPGHIACDSNSRSEIVIPLMHDGKTFGVLDLDSYQPSAFNHTDKLYLEMLCKLITDKLNYYRIVSIIY